LWLGGICGSLAENTDSYSTVLVIISVIGFHCFIGADPYVCPADYCTLRVAELQTRANTWVRMQRCGVNRESGNNIKGLQGKLMFSLLIDWENRCKEIDTELN